MTCLNKQASTIPCAGITAWNALNGLKSVGKLRSALMQGMARSTYISEISSQKPSAE